MSDNLCYFYYRKLKAFIKQWKLKDIVKNQDKTRWEEDYTLLENEGLFDEYLEMGQSLIIKYIWKVYK